MRTPYLLLALAALFFPVSAQAALFWGGADVRTSGFDLHAGTSLLPIPFIATAGLEAGWSQGNAEKGSQMRFGATLRDINIPFSKTDAFLSGGAAYHTGASNTSYNGLGLYTEGGLSGHFFGPVGWRASVRSDTKTGLSAGVGIEAKF